MPADLDAIPTHLVEVAAVRTRGCFQRVTLAGRDLVGSQEIAPDDFAYLLLPPPGRSALTIDRSFRWADVARMPADARPVGAYYTVVERRPDVGEWDIDVLLHADPGPAASWAATARPGDPAALWGPRTAWDPPHDVDTWVLLADGTGLPAVRRIVRAVAGRGAPDDRIVVLLSGPDTTSVGIEEGRDLVVVPIDLEHARGVAHATALALGALAGDRPYVWAGAEERAVRSLRAALRDAGVSAARCSLTAYWRRRGPAPGAST